MIRVNAALLDAAAFDAFPAIRRPGAMLAIATNIMEGARAKLIKIAGQELHSTRMDYIQGIQQLEFMDDGVALVIAGALPLMIEHGWDARYLHETLLHNPDAKGNIKTSKEGKKYRSIPFRHKTPGTLKQGGQPMGSQFEAKGGLSREQPKTIVNDSASLGKAIHKKAKQLKQNKRLPAGLAPKMREKHTTDPFAGMKANLQPVQKKGGAPGEVSYQRTYTTFRTISENVTDKWYHPGIEARNFLDRVHDYVTEVTPGAIQAYIDSALGEGTAP